MPSRARTSPRPTAPSSLRKRTSSRPLSIARAPTSGMLRRLALDDMDEAARVFRTSFDQALPTLRGLHTPDEDRAFFRARLFATCELSGAFADGAMAGFIAFREGWIEQLYVLPDARGQGIGTALLKIAQHAFDHLQLWTFQRNTNARRFYEA